MPDSVIQQVETLGIQATPNAFNFSDRNGILFEWNNDTAENHDNLIEEDPSHTLLLLRNFLVSH
jgi:hypothetical protein